MNLIRRKRILKIQKLLLWIVKNPSNNEYNLNNVASAMLVPFNVALTNLSSTNHTQIFYDFSNAIEASFLLHLSPSQRFLLHKLGTTWNKPECPTPCKISSKARTCSIFFYLMQHCYTSAKKYFSSTLFF